MQVRCHKGLEARRARGAAVGNKKAAPGWKPVNKSVDKFRVHLIDAADTARKRGLYLFGLFSVKPARLIIL